VSADEPVDGVFLGGGVCRFAAFDGAILQLFVGGFAVDGLFVDARHERLGEQDLALLGRDGADLAARRDDEHAFGDGRAAFFIEQAD